MTISLTSEQKKWLDSAVAAGRFSSIESALDAAIVGLMTEPEELDDDWLKPSLDAAREAVARGEGLSLDDFRAHMARRRAKVG